MKKVIIYCHGYNSSAQSDKVKRLSAAGEVYAWNINIDPEVSLDDLEQKIDDLLISKMNEDFIMVFVGTSLGAWYASKLADIYSAYAVLINPAIDPKTSLTKYGVDESILNNYLNPIFFCTDDKVFIGTEDEIIDFSNANFGAASVEYVKAKHRFNGPEFDMVVEYIQNMREIK